MPRCCALGSLCILVIAALLAPGKLVRGGDAVTVRDAGGQAVTISDTSRIVSVGGSVTEILYALGLESRVIAVDSTSQFPPRALADKKNVGYMRQLSAEGVLGLAPSVVLAADGSGPKETIAVLQSAAVPFVRIPDRFTGEGIVEKIKLIAAATETAARGECLAETVAADLAALTKLRARISEPVRVLFVLSFMNDRPMVAGRNTAADGIIRLAGGVNASADFEGYKIVNDEAVIAAKPDAILAMERPQFALLADQVFAHPAFTLTPAATRKRLISMEGLYLLGFGPRTARAARDLAGALYPALQTEALPSERTSEACAQ
jgi:iron complex transport system substrate-binding protein